jgi:glycosyltransferase involved in cell wall biosynthesis
VRGQRENIKVAVVIPCYNHGAYIGEAVASALSQSLPPAKVVVVDDGSDEPSIDAALAALPAEVELIRQERKGRGVARNVGAAAAGDAHYILMLDSDDLLPEDAIANLHGTLSANPKAGFASGRMRYFGDWSGEVKLPPFDPYAILYRPTTGWIGMLRREAFDACGGYDTELEGYEDWDLILGILEKGWEAEQVDEVVLEYRKHGQSSLANDRDKHRHLYRALRHRHRELYSNAPELARQSDLSASQRLVYRTFWAWRPVPARVERAVYSRLFRPEAAS